VFLLLKLIELDFWLRFVSNFFINFGLSFDLVPFSKTKIIFEFFLIKFFKSPYGPLIPFWFKVSTLTFSSLNPFESNPFVHFNKFTYSVKKLSSFTFQFWPIKPLTNICNSIFYLIWFRLWFHSFSRFVYLKIWPIKLLIMSCNYSFASSMI